MPGKLMIQGTGSNVGKTVIVAGLCRAFADLGFRVRPFKPQNMSNNAVAIDGGEISRAQALQARACRVKPSVDMNPILLKPESESGSQVIVRGKMHSTLTAGQYLRRRAHFLDHACESFRRVAADAEIVLIEGAGSPAETNLRNGDLANMGFATRMSVPVVLVSDIDRGGTIAQLVGTHEVLNARDTGQIRGFIINRFRGDQSLFADGYRFIERRTGWKGIGIVPWLECVRMLPAEDAQDLSRIAPTDKPARVVCLRLPRIANFDDLDPLRMEPTVSLGLLEPGHAIPGDTDLVIIPGTKSTRHDLAFLKAQGWDTDLQAHVRRGGFVLGICGGFQMLGRRIRDENGVEGSPGTSVGLGLLDVETMMQNEKRVAPVEATYEDGKTRFKAYEIHIGRTAGPDMARPFAKVDDNGVERSEGAVSESGRVFGTYLHGLFADDGMRREFLRRLSIEPGDLNYERSIERTLDELASHLSSHLDTEWLLETMQEQRQAN